MNKIILCKMWYHKLIPKKMWKFFKIKNPKLFLSLPQKFDDLNELLIEATNNLKRNKNENIM